MTNRFEIFTVLINRINRNIRKIKNMEMSDYNLKSSHISCLYYLYISGGLTATQLCEKCEEDKATISRSLDYLEESGYISCQAEGGRKYKNPITLTDKGGNVGKEIASKINSVLTEISVALSEEERVNFYRSLNVISNYLEIIVKRNEDKE